MPIEDILEINFKTKGFSTKSVVGLNIFGRTVRTKGKKITPLRCGMMMNKGNGKMGNITRLHSFIVEEISDDNEKDVQMNVVIFTNNQPNGDGTDEKDEISYEELAQSYKLLYEKWLEATKSN